MLVVVVVVVVVLLTGGFYVSGLFFLATGTPPQLLRPVKASTGSDLSSTLATFGCFIFCQAFYLTVLPRALRF